VVLSLSLLGNGWLIRQRQRRLVISANIVVQLFNAYVGSRAKALDAISKHNGLAERYNRLSDERSALALQLAGQKVEEPASQMDYDRARQDKGVQQSAPVEEPLLPAEGEAEGDAELQGVHMLRAQLKDFETKLQRKDAQLQAKENQITNLRSRLTRAHDSLEGQRQPKPGTK
jgi:chromosome segregation ATPase